MAYPQAWFEVCSNKAVIMGLKRYAFRREYCAAMLEQVGFSSLECVDAFDGFQEDVDAAMKELGVLFNPQLGRGHKGCSYTMMREWKRMLDDGASYRIFFEDDALGHLDLPNGLGQKMWDATPKDFDIVYMGNMMGAVASADLVVQQPTHDGLQLQTTFLLSILPVGANVCSKSCPFFCVNPRTTSVALNFCI
jgi:GR25 family glycosyltransferase involved in LPS biosynthesis